MIPSLLSATFRSLRNFNYRIWAAGALVSNVGTWMQRIAQDWLVLTVLTQHKASAVGVVMALQYGPHILLLPLTGFAADHFDRRKLMMFTQAGLGVLAFGLGLLTVGHLVQLWHVYVFAFLFGCVTAFDAPARQTFVSELVGETDLSNAVSLNSTSFNAARMIGPAIAGLLIAAVGIGPVFMLNGLSFAAVLCSLLTLRTAELRRSAHTIRPSRGFADGFRYVASRPDLITMLIMLFLIGTFGLNFPIFISTMSLRVFHSDAGGYGLLMSMMSVGTIAGALLSAARARPGIHVLFFAALLFGVGCLVACVMPNYWLFGAALVVVGLAALTFTNAANSLVQLAATPAMRGRVTAIRLAIALGGTPFGAPLVGWVADRYGPRWSLAVGGASGIAAAGVAVYYLVRYRHLRLAWRAGRARLEYLREAPSSAHHDE